MRAETTTELVDQLLKKLEESESWIYELAKDENSKFVRRLTHRQVDVVLEYRANTSYTMSVDKKSVGLTNERQDIVRRIINAAAQRQTDLEEKALRSKLITAIDQLD